MRIHVNPASERLRSFTEHLPELFGTGGEVLHTGRNTIKAFEVGDIRVAVKRFRRPNLFQAFIYTFFAGARPAAPTNTPCGCGRWASTRPNPSRGANTAATDC